MTTTPTPHDKATGLAFFLSRLFELDPIAIQNEAHALATAARANPRLLALLPWAALAAKAAEWISEGQDKLPPREDVLTALAGLLDLDAAAVAEAVAFVAAKEAGH